MNIWVLVLNILIYFSLAPLHQDIKTENKNLEWLKAEATSILNNNKPDDIQSFSFCIESDGRFELSIIREGFRETYSSFFDALDYSKVNLGKNSLELNCHSTYCIEYSKLFPGNPERNEREFEEQMAIPLQQGGGEVNQLKKVLEKAIKQAGGKRLKDLVFDDRC